MSKLFLANVISIIHFFLIFYILLCPFRTVGLYCDIFYLVLIPVVIMHWLLTDDSCALTVIENYLRGMDISKVNVNNNYMYRLIYPIYNTPSIVNGNFIYIILLYLYIIELRKFCYNLKNNYYTNTNI
uniref:Uncharacterized protein n=1 Tax=viral metagenome TaxID=1070528 RepID=A0A6C0CZH1_9ZZZZ